MPHAGFLRRRAFFAVVIALTAAAMSGDMPSPPRPQATTSPSVTFGVQSLTIGPVTSGGSVYVFGVSREPRDYYTAVVPRETVLHASPGATTVEWILDKPVERRSVWFAVDLATGAFASGSPPAYASSGRALTGSNLVGNAPGVVSQLSFAGTLVEMVVVRPGSGVWGMTLVPGDARDEGTEAQSPTISVANLQPRGGTTAAAPAALQSGDVVFMLDSYHAEYAVEKVGEGR
jgi:hypothetical protein